MLARLKEAESAAFLRAAMPRLRPSLIITSTAFAAAGGTDAQTPLDEAGVPVLQAVVATTKRAAWADSSRGLGAADLAMHVVLPELDGRILEANDALLEMIGYTRQELDSGQLRWDAITPADQKAADERALAQLRETGMCLPFLAGLGQRNVA
jgi:cobalamin biosynthesis Mg chelatase CobN